MFRLIDHNRSLVVMKKISIMFSFLEIYVGKQEEINHIKLQNLIYNCIHVHLAIIALSNTQHRDMHDTSMYMYMYMQVYRRV